MKNKYFHRHSVVMIGEEKQRISFCFLMLVEAVGGREAGFVLAQLS